MEDRKRLCCHRGARKRMTASQLSVSLGYILTMSTIARQYDCPHMGLGFLDNTPTHGQSLEHSFNIKDSTTTRLLFSHYCVIQLPAGVNG